MNESLVDAWSGDQFDSVLHQMRRFVVGDETHGYALAHPRLREYMRDPRRIRSIASYRDKLLAYCADWSEHRSPYALAHYAQHLTEAGETARLIRLVEDPEWQRARRTNDIAGSGLAEDVEWARKAADSGGMAMLSEYLAVSLLQARLKSSITNIPPQAITALAHLGDLPQALALSKLIVEETIRIGAIWKLGLACLDLGELEVAVQLLKETRNAIIRRDDSTTFFNLARIARHFTQAQQPIESQRTLDVAFDLIHALDAVDMSMALADLVRGMSDYDVGQLRSRLAQAEQAARQIEGIHSYRGWALLRIAERLDSIDQEHARALVEEALALLSSAPASYVEEGVPGVVFSQRDAFIAKAITVAVALGVEHPALDLVDSINDGTQQFEVCAGLVRVYAEQERVDDAILYLEQAMTTAETELTGMVQEDARQVLVDLLGLLGKVDQAQEVAQQIQHDSPRVNAFCRIAYKLSRQDMVQDARAWIDLIDRDWGIVFGKTAIAEGLLETNPDTAIVALKEALELAPQMREGLVGIQYQAYETIANCTQELIPTRPDEAKHLISRLVADVQSATGRDAFEISAVSQARDEALSNLAEALANLGDQDNATIALRSIDNRFVRDMAYLQAARAAYVCGDCDRAEVLLSELATDCCRAIGEVVKEGWRLSNSSLPEAMLQQLQVTMPQVCNQLAYPPDAVGFVAFELGAAGHLSAARTLWQGTDKYLQKFDSKLELLKFFAQIGNLEDAEEFLGVIDTTDSKVQALAYLARYVADKDATRAHALIDQAWSTINPYNLPPHMWAKGWRRDKTLIVLAGTIARWDLQKAEWIINELLEKDESRRRAHGG